MDSFRHVFEGFFIRVLFYGYSDGSGFIWYANDGVNTDSGASFQILSPLRILLGSSDTK